MAEGELLWRPTPERIEDSRMTEYMRWLGTRGVAVDDYDALWRWSVEDPGAFWQSVWSFFEVEASVAPSAALVDASMPGTRWFPGTRLNHAQHLLRRRDDHLAIIAIDEEGNERKTSYGELATLTSRVAAGLRAAGVGEGDRVAAVVTNVPEALAAFLATASLGAIWSSCAAEFGADSVLDRFRQIEPRVLFCVDGYRYGGRGFDRREEIGRIVEGLPSLEAVVRIPGPQNRAIEGAVDWEEFLGPAEDLAFAQVPFDHPLWVLYSSGTTGLPKPIVHGHGGILLEHYKAIALHGDLGPDDRFFWYTTTGWMMWNYLISVLLVGGTAVLYDGSPMHPDPMSLWTMAARTGVTFFGVSAPYLMACRKQGLRPGASLDLSALRGVGSTGAPLPAEGFEWVYAFVGDDLNLASICGGTDVCTAFILGAPTLPVYSGEIQCRGLGCAVEAWDADGLPVVGSLGELVLTVPLPSMPVFFWNDEGGDRLRESYFSAYPGTWRHGDWIKVTERGTLVVYGRSDSTLNRGGVRMGTSEFYRVVEAFDGVRDSLVVDTGALGREGLLWLFLVTEDGTPLSADRMANLKSTLRRRLSPRHVPDRVEYVPEIPYTLSGKKIEVPIKRILAGVDPDVACNADTLKNPAALEHFLSFEA